MKLKQHINQLFIGSILLKVLFWAIIVAAALHIIWQLIAGPEVPGQYDLLSDIARRFGLDSELSFPTWLVSAMALIVAVYMFVAARHTTSRSARIMWYVLAAGLLLLAIDETTALHELVVQGVHVSADLGEQQTFTSNAWLLLSPLILAGGIGLVYALYRTLPRATFWRFAIAFAVYFAGAFVVEYLSIQIDKAELTYRIGLVVIEESFELIGVWLLLRGTLLHVREQQPKLQAQLGELFHPVSTRD